VTLKIAILVWEGCQQQCLGFYNEANSGWWYQKAMQQNKLLCAGKELGVEIYCSPSLLLKNTMSNTLGKVVYVQKQIPVHLFSK
jgi:hypothetical protein